MEKHLDEIIFLLDGVAGGISVKSVKKEIENFKKKWDKDSEQHDEIITEYFTNLYEKNESKIQSLNESLRDYLKPETTPQFKKKADNECVLLFTEMFSDESLKALKLSDDSRIRFNILLLKANKDYSKTYDTTIYHIFKIMHLIFGKAGYQKFNNIAKIYEEKHVPNKGGDDTGKIDINELLNDTGVGDILKKKGMDMNKLTNSIGPSHLKDALSSFKNNRAFSRAIEKVFNGVNMDNPANAMGDISKMFQNKEEIMKFMEDDGSDTVPDAEAGPSDQS